MLCTLYFSSGGCGSSSSVNNSYFSSSSGDSSPCSFTVCKSESNICQIRSGVQRRNCSIFCVILLGLIINFNRLDFDTFVTESPSTAVNSPLSTVPTGH